MTGQDPIPDRLGPYLLLDRIGEGGMGVVFLARDPSQRTVALKVLRPGVAAEPNARRRLAREVATMRRVRSPFVAEVIDADLSDDMPYIVTRYVPGSTLEETVTERGPLSGPGLARLACGLAEALQAVHAAGVVHRDLKPSNVMLVNGVPVVIDFGIAQGPDTTRLTLTGMFMGTPGYLSPEVIEGSPSSEASDVHAWGATVAYAATGRPPFGTGPYETVFFRIVNGHPDLIGCPQPILPLLASALARDPAHRPTAASLSVQAAALDPAALVPGAAPAPAPQGLPGPAVPTRAEGQPGGLYGAGAGALAGSAWPGVMAPDGGAAPPGYAGQPGFAEPGPAPPGYAPPGYDAPPGYAPGVAAGAPGTSPLRAGPGADDFADVLPPVAYRRPGRDPAGVDVAAAGPSGPFASAAGGPASRWRAMLVLATMLVAAGLSVVFPVAGTAAALCLIIALRTAELASSRMGQRRRSRGARASDPVVAVLSVPWFLVRAVLTVAVLAPFALAGATVAAGVTIAVAPAHPLPRALAYAAGALVLFYGLGPGSGRSRRQLGQIIDAVTPGGRAQAVAALAGLALAAAALAAAFSWPSFYWPTVPPGGFLHIGFVHIGIPHIARPRWLGAPARWPLVPPGRW